MPGFKKSRLHTCTINHIWQEQHQIGKNTQIASVAIIAMNNGSEYFVVSCTEQSMILEQVYNATPTGGVEQPMVTMVIMMMPK